MLNEFKKNFKLGIAGFLSLWLAGCATFPGYEYTPITRVEHAYKEQKVSSRKEKIGSTLEYHVSDMKSKEQNLEFSISEAKKDINNIITTTIVPVYEVTDQCKFRTTQIWFLLWVSDKMTGDLEESTPISRKKIKDEISENKEKKGEIVYENQPARDALVKVSSQYFGFGANKDSSILTRTDANGIARTQITKMPYLFYFDENEAKKDIVPILRKGIKPALFNNFKLEDIVFKITNKEYPLEIKTMSEANVALNAEENLKFKDDNKTFYVNGKEINLSPLYSYIENIIKTELENKYTLRSFVLKPVGEDNCPISGVEVNFKAIKTLSQEELSKETEKIKENYLVRGEELFEHVNINSSYLISNIDGQKAEIPAEGLPIIVNVPSEYEITARKDDYYPIKGVDGRVKFTETSKKEFNVEMSELGTKVRLGGGKSSIKQK